MNQRFTRKKFLSLPDGRIIELIWGAEDDEDDDDEDKDGDKDGDKNGADGGTDKDKSSSKEEVVPKSELEALHERMRAADRRASAAELKLREIDDKDKSELDKATRDLGEVTTERDKLKTDLDSVRLQLAFVSDNKFQWNNPKAALKLADLSEVKIGEDGSVTGLDKALQALAKSDPYLLKGKAEDDDEDEDPPSGSGSTKRRKDDKAKVDKEALARQYPALRGRL